jgi:ubiquinone/menaquinone biosynthesis C-methylase UbiE
MDKTKIAVEIFDKRAKEYQEKFMDVSLYGESFALFCNALRKQDAEILELACGPGNITKFLLQKNPHLKIYGIDLSPQMIELAKVNNPSAEFEIMDCRNIGLLQKKFDAIMCGFCLPYLSKEEALSLIGDATRLLLPGGSIYISTMEDAYSTSGIRTSSYGDKMYMYFHEADYLCAALEKNKFRIIDLQRKIYSAPDGTTTTDLIIIAGL